MLSNKFGVIAGVAMLGTAALLGTNAANAIGIDSQGQVTSPVRYAQETLMKQASDNDDLAGHYTLTPAADAHDVVLGGLTYGSTDNFNLTVTLIDMKFAAAVPSGDDAVDLGTNNDEANVRRHMGAIGDDTVLLAFSSDAPQDMDQMLTINLPALAISAGAEMGSIMVRLVNASTEEAFGTGTGTVEETYTGAIKIVQGLKEDFKKPKNNPVASVGSGFKLFDDGTEDGAAYTMLGTLELSAEPMVVNAADGGLVAVGDLIKVADDDEESSSVSFSGDFSSAMAVWLEEMDGAGDDDDCSGTPPANADAGNLLKIEDEVVAMESLSANVSTLTGANSHTLCMAVYPTANEKSTPIEAGTYSVVPSYLKVEDARALTPESEPTDLASIKRDGTTVRLPFLTTAPQFKQLIIVTNRGAKASYYFEFTPEDGVDATGKSMAKGDLESDETTIMRTTDVVDITVGERTTGRTAGTLVVEAQRSMIDVATNQVNRDTGNSDLVTYDDR